MVHIRVLDVTFNRRLPQRPLLRWPSTRIITLPHPQRLRLPSARAYYFLAPGLRRRQRSGKAAGYASIIMG